MGKGDTLIYTKVPTTKTTNTMMTSILHAVSLTDLQSVVSKFFFIKNFINFYFYDKSSMYSSLLDVFLDIQYFGNISCRCRTLRNFLVESRYS